MAQQRILYVFSVNGQEVNSVPVWYFSWNEEKKKCFLNCMFNLKPGNNEEFFPFSLTVIEGEKVLTLGTLFGFRQLRKVKGKAEINPDREGVFNQKGIYYAVNILDPNLPARYIEIQ